MATTIQIGTATKHQLESLKESQRQTYEEVIEKLIELAKEENAELTDEAREAVRRARDDIKHGRVCTTKELIKELGI